MEKDGGNLSNLKPNVLLVVLDCLRRDYWRKGMPLARKATRGWFYLENHWAVAHCSDPNHAALFTGFGPWQTKVTTQMSAEFRDALPTMFWRWKRDVGGTVWTVQSVRVPKFYRDHVDLLAWHKITDSSDLELRAVRQFTHEAQPDKPWLGFVRSMTCHWPYLELPSPPRGEGGARDQYEQAVAHEDQFIKNLTEFILSEYPNTIIVCCSDHGELLGEHGVWDHLYTLYSILTWVPMVVYVPGAKHRKTNRPTQHIDLWPTLCDLLGLDRQGEGVSWAKWITGDEAHPSPADRPMQMQGTGAGPLDKEQQAKTRNLDPGVGRQVWRHRGVVRGALKLVEDWHAEGRLETHATNARDYRERKTNKRAEDLWELLPPIPAYHPWEKRAVFGDVNHKTDEEIILERLRALGYA